MFHKLKNLPSSFGRSLFYTSTFIEINQKESKKYLIHLYNLKNEVMKKIIFILFSIVILTALSCKKEKNVNAIVVKDCTGIYLNIGGSDYAVCNAELILQKSDGDAVTVTYKPSKLDCTGQYVSCTTKHEHSGWIVIEKVK